MSARSWLAAAVLAAGVSGAGAKDLADQCVGGRWDEILAQSGILHARKFPEYGLSEKLAFECPSFVHQVLTADSLDAGAKREAFAAAPSWPKERLMRFYLKLRAGNRNAFREAWKVPPTEADLAGKR